MNSATSWKTGFPKPWLDRLESDDDLFDRVNLDTQPYRFLISLREDYLPDLEEWSDLIPRLGPNRYRLLPMSTAQATEAIEKTGGSLVTHDDAVNIVSYLSQSQTSNNESAQQRRRKLAQVEPALLSSDVFRTQRRTVKKPERTPGNG